MRLRENKMIRFIAVGSILLSILLSGCHYNEEIRIEPDMEKSVNDDNGKMQIEPDMEESVNDNLDIQNVEEISVAVKGFDMENPHCDYTGEAIKIEYQYMAYVSKSFGIMILCDGIAVPFYTDLEKEEKRLHIIPNKGNRETVDVNLYVIPRGQKGDTVELSIVDIVEPDYNIQTVEEMTADAATKILINGKRYWCGYTGPIAVKMMADGLRKQEDICEEFAYTEMPYDVLEEDMISSEGGKINKNFWGEIEINGSIPSLLYQVKQGEILDIEITCYGTEGQEIMTSCYLDNAIHPVFDGKNYASCYVDSIHYSTVEGSIDTGKLEKGTHVVYFICGGGISYNRGLGRGTNAFILVVE